MSTSDDRTGFPAGRQYAPNDRTDADDIRSDSDQDANQPAHGEQWREPTDLRRNVEPRMSDYLNDPETDRGPKHMHGSDDRLSQAGNGQREAGFGDHGFPAGHDNGHGYAPSPDPAEAAKPRVNAFGLPIQEPIQATDLPPADALREFTEPLKRAKAVPDSLAPRPAPDAPPARVEPPEPPGPPAQSERPEPPQQPVFGEHSEPPQPSVFGEHSEPPQQPVFGEHSEPPQPPVYAEHSEPPQQPVFGEHSEPPQQPVFGEHSEPPQPPVFGEHSEPPQPQPQPEPQPPSEPQAQLPESQAETDAVDRFIADEPIDDQEAAAPPVQPDYEPFEHGARDLDDTTPFEGELEPADETSGAAADHAPEVEEHAEAAPPETGRKRTFGLGRFFKRKSQPEADEAAAPVLDEAYQARDLDEASEDADLAPDVAEDSLDSDLAPLPGAPEAPKALHSDDGKTVVRSGARAVPAREARSRTRSWDELEGADTFGADDLDTKAPESYRELDDEFDDLDDEGISEPGYGARDQADPELESDVDEALQEDAEFPFPEEPKKRRGTLVAAALVGAIALGGALAFAYKVVTGPSGDGGPPVIRADESPTKVEPAQPGGRTFANQNKLIYDRLDGQGQDAVERVIPRSEEARELPAPPATAGEAGDAAASLTDRVRQAINTPNPAASAPSTEADGAPNPRRVRTMVIRPDGTVLQQEESAPAQPAPSAPAAAATPAKPAAPEPAAPQEQTVAAVEPAASSEAGGFVVQLGARRSESAAMADFSKFQQKYPSLLNEHKPLIQRADLGSKGVYYRLRVGPLETKSDANRLCTRLKSAGLRDCLVRAR